MATDWDKTKPAGSTKIRLSDEQIRANNAALEDAIGRDHSFPGAQGTTAGQHLQVTFYSQIADPDPDADSGALYIKDFGGKAELHWENEGLDIIQLTTEGKIGAAAISMLADDLDMTGTLTVGEDIDVTGSGTIDVDLGVGGNATIGGTLGITGLLSGNGGIVTADHGDAATDQVVNVCYGTGDPPAAATTTIGALFIKYEA